MQGCRIKDTKDVNARIQDERILGYRMQMNHTLRSLVAPTRGAGGFKLCSIVSQSFFGGRICVTISFHDRLPNRPSLHARQALMF